MRKCARLIPDAARAIGMVARAETGTGRGQEPGFVIRLCVSVTCMSATRPLSS